MCSRVYVAVGCPSVCLSHRSTAATAAGGFAAEQPADSHGHVADVVLLDITVSVSLGL